ncbi:MAG: beta-lactamase family protein [Acidobacteria bacterium]|nr:beta-lactamase family protein [Acidobacteriota bacterium]
MNPDTRIYIASNTKSFTALAAALLNHRGALALGAPVRQYLPCAPFPPATRPDAVTLRDLLIHRNGERPDGLQDGVFRAAHAGRAEAPVGVHDHQ